MINALKVENIVTLYRFYKEIIDHLVKIGVLILKIESVEKSTYRLPLLVLLCRKFDMSPFQLPNLKIIFIIFFPFRLTNARNLTVQQINWALKDIPFDSDKSGQIDNSDMYENWLPAGEETQRRHPCYCDDVGAILEAGGGAVAEYFPDLDRSEVPTPLAGPVQPPQKRSHPSTKAKVWEWQKRNLSPKHEAPACKLCEA